MFDIEVYEDVTEIVSNSDRVTILSKCITVKMSEEFDESFFKSIKMQILEGKKVLLSYRE
jgi:hypothetical protein